MAASWSTVCSRTSSRMLMRSWIGTVSAMVTSDCVFVAMGCCAICVASMEWANLDWISEEEPEAGSSILIQVGRPSRGAKIQVVPSCSKMAEGDSNGTFSPFLHRKQEVARSGHPAWQEEHMWV